MKEKMNFFLCVNSKAMLGLGTTLVSLIRNCNFTEKISIGFLCNSLSTIDKNNIKALLKNENFKGEYKFIDFDAEKDFENLKPYHGDKTVFGRFLIPKFMDSGFAYYLDTDLVITLDVLNLKIFNSQEIISAVERRKFRDGKESLFFTKFLNLDPNISYFNSGILVINIDKWKSENFTEKLMQIGEMSTPYYTMADQTFLNAAVAGKYTKMPIQYNLPFPPSKDSIHTENSVIIHFIGSPKPWDFFGSVIHNGYPLWRKYQTHFWLKKYNRISIPRIKRLWAIRKEYLKRKERIFHKFKEMLRFYQ